MNNQNFVTGEQNQPLTREQVLTLLGDGRGRMALNDQAALAEKLGAVPAQPRLLRISRYVDRPEWVRYVDHPEWVVKLDTVGSYADEWIAYPVSAATLANHTA